MLESKRNNRISLEQESKDCKKSECVTVVVRCRPMSQKEITMGYSEVVEMWPSDGTVSIRNPKNDANNELPKTFTFDSVYDWNSTQRDLYDETVRPLVQSVLSGFNATIFAYGQTGTGKTYTMEGCRNPADPEADESGIIPKSFQQIFTHIARTTDVQHLIRASYLEIYQEEIRDLLDKNPNKRYELRESKEVGVYVRDLQSFVCRSAKEIERVMITGNKNRTIGATDMNEHSSRSHAIFIITIEMSNENSHQVKVGKLNLVDLAGSERQAKTGAIGDRLKEASKINLSLSALGNVISALVNDRCRHVPYRDSKLTRLLQDSLGGNSKTLMVANIGPASYNYEETLTTLRYANRAKNIQNKPRINEDPKDALIRKYQDEIERLKSILSERMTRSKSAEQNLREREDKLEEQKAEILRNEDNISKEDCDKLLREIEEKQRLIDEERKQARELAEQISSMESKLLQGGKNIMDRTNEQEKALEKRLEEIRIRKKMDLEMKKKLNQVEESFENAKTNLSNLLEVVEAKKKNLSKILSKVQRCKQDLNDSIEEYNENRRYQEQCQQQAMKEIKLRQMIIDNFIPPDDKIEMENNLIYDEDDSRWITLAESQSIYIKGRPISSPSLRFPTCEYAKRNMDSDNLRFKRENLIKLELEKYENPVKRYEMSAVNSTLRLMLESALKAEDDLEIDAARFTTRIGVPLATQKPKGEFKMRPATAGGIAKGKIYPLTRGLVSK